MESLRFFLYSCANWGYGYFNAYDVGSRYNLDFWVHLGDYVGASLAAAAAFLTYKCTVYSDVICSANNKAIGHWQDSMSISVSSNEKVSAGQQSNTICDPDLKGL